MTDTTTPAPEAPSFTVQPGGEESVSTTRAPDGSYTTSQQGGDTTPVDVEAVDNAELDAELAEGAEEEPKVDGEEPEAEEPAEKPEAVAIDLPDYDPADEAVVAQYVEKYTLEDGTRINFEAFNASFLANLDNGLADINPQERALVKDKFGLSDDAIDTYLSGVAQQVSKKNAEFDTTVQTLYGGTKEDYTAAFEWAKGDGYTAEQKARFNAALDAAAAGDTSLLEDQQALLKARFEASGKAAPKVDPKPAAKPRREVSPQASATVSSPAGGKGGPEKYATYAEFTGAQAAALASGDRAAMAEVQARLRATPEFWKGK